MIASPFDPERHISTLKYSVFPQNFSSLNRVPRRGRQSTCVVAAAGIPVANQPKLPRRLLPHPISTTIQSSSTNISSVVPGSPSKCVLKFDSRKRRYRLSKLELGLRANERVNA